MPVSEGDWVTMFEKVSDLLYTQLISATEDSPTVQAQLQAIRDNAVGILTPEVERQVQAWRRKRAGLVDSTQIQAFYGPLFETFLRDLTDNEGVTDPIAGFPLIYDSFLARGLYVASRGATFGSVSAAGTGGGTALRLTTDHRGQTIEGTPLPLDVVIRCEQLQRLRPGEPQYKISGPALSDILEQGSGGTFDPAGRLTGRNSGGLIADGSFGIASAAESAPSDLGAWTGWDGTDDVAITGTDYETATTGGVDGSASPWMSSVNEASSGVPLALGLKTTNGIRQQITSPPGLFTPILPALVVYRPASLTAVDLAVHWGSKSQTFDETDFTADTWVLVYPDLDKDLYGYNWQDNDNYIGLLPANRAGSGSLWVDNVRVHPFTFWGGLWWMVLAGVIPDAVGASERSYSFAHTLSGSDSVIQRLMQLGYGRYLPSSGSTLITDPS
jgi:hypothetical protein